MTTTQPPKSGVARPHSTQASPTAIEKDALDEDLPLLPTGMRIGLFFVAAVFLIVGLIGLALPIVPQAIPLIVGVALLSLVSRRFNRLLLRTVSRWPRIARRVRGVQAWFHRRLHREEPNGTMPDESADGKSGSQ